MIDAFTLTSTPLDPMTNSICISSSAVRKLSRLADNGCRGDENILQQSRDERG